MQPGAAAFPSPVRSLLLGRAVNILWKSWRDAAAGGLFWIILPGLYVITYSSRKGEIHRVRQLGSQAIESTLGESGSPVHAVYSTNFLHPCRCTCFRALWSPAARYGSNHTRRRTPVVR